MARSQIQKTTDDLVSDSGAVLFSFVQGEQLEYPVSLNFLLTSAGYEYEAVVVESLNIEGQTEPPTSIRPAGIQTSLVVRVPTHRGNWDAPQAYNAGESTLYNGVIYRLKIGAARISAITPDIDPMWEVSSLSVVFVQFPSTLGATWQIQPGVTYNSYGFFELRVTEPSGTFRKTWKPVRGMVELQFSPTHLVP